MTTPASGSPGNPAIELHRGPPGARELERINALIAAAIGTWNLPERVKRISLPLYCYGEADLPHMQFVVARAVDSGEIVGLAAVEDADAADAPQPGARLLHGIYVDPRYHRKGFGSMLLQAAESMAVDGGASGLLVKARPDAAAFFESRSYRGLPIGNRARDYAHRFWKPL